MENKTNAIETKQAWYVTHNSVKEVTTFTIDKCGSYGVSPVTFYWDEKGWKEVHTYDNPIAYTQEDVKTLQVKKLQSQIEYLSNSRTNTTKQLEENQTLLNSLLTK